MFFFAFMGMLWCSLIIIRLALYLRRALDVSSDHGQRRPLNDRSGNSGRHTPLKEWRRHVGEPPVGGV